MNNIFLFRPLDFSDIPLMHNWFNSPHVQKFYSLRPWTENEVLNKLKPYIEGSAPVKGYIVLMNNNPLGYMQYCKIRDYPWPNQDLSEDVINKAAGVDMFIGDEMLIGKGLGCKILKAFLHEVIWPEFEYCLMDPDITNTAAIRCYEKLDFKEHATLNSKDALDKPVTLKLMILQRDIGAQYDKNA